MKSWVKLYTDINEDPKMRPFTWAQKGIWSALLALAGKLDVRNGDGAETGELHSIEDTAWAIRCEIGEFTEAIRAFSHPVGEDKRGMLYEQDGLLFITNYGKRQARPPSARPEATKERKRQQRAKESQASHEDVTREPGPVTPLDTDTDTDTTIETEEIDMEVGPPSPKPRKRRSRADPRTKHPAIQAVRLVTGRLPAKAIYNRIIKLLGEEPDTENMTQCFEEWVIRGFKVTNFAWLFEWFVSGIPPKRRGQGSVQDKTAGVIKRYRERHGGDT